MARSSRNRLQGSRSRDGMASLINSNATDSALEPLRSLGCLKSALLSPHKQLLEQKQRMLSVSGRKAKIWNEQLRPFAPTTPPCANNLVDRRPSHLPQR